ncbi:MAG: patatin-like phospholipase family protein [Elusimicrobium sp.]|jgi:NTE family protein|nr:patatin-like phospholipase family protein [Elusimicrobium sp.]
MKKIFLIVFAFAALPGFAYDAGRQDALLRDFLWKEFINTPKEQRAKVGLALSAGGTRGFAHVGVLEVLENAGAPVDMLTGTSMGAVVGSGYAAGLPVSRLWEIGNSIRLGTVSKDLGATGMMKLFIGGKLPSSKNFEAFLEETLQGKNIEDLNIPFACPAMDIKTGEKILFTSGPAALAVRASMNLPGIFEPVEYRQRQLVDGGVVDYLPVDAVRNLGARYVIASLPLQDYSGVVPKTVAAYLLRIGDIRGAILTEEAVAKANFVIRIKVSNIEVLDFNKLPAAAELGIRETYRVLPMLQDDLIIFNIKYREHEK